MSIRLTIITTILIIWGFNCLAQIDTTSQNISEVNDTISKSKHLLDGLKIISEKSKDLNGWNLLIIAGSIAAIVSTSYLRPQNKKGRLIYLLFIPGWIFISLSIYYGEQISRRYLAAILKPTIKNLNDIKNFVNLDFIAQLDYLQFGLLSFGIWLLMFLFLWIFKD